MRSPFLNIGMISAIFQSSGTSPDSNDWVKIRCRIRLETELVFFRSLLFILSQPADDEVLRELIKFAIPAGVTVTCGMGIAAMAGKKLGLLVAEENTEQK